MDLNIINKVAIVTGAGQGIGRAIVQTFAREGAKVVVADLVQDRAVTVASDIENTGGKALAAAVDVTKAEEVNAMVENVVERFGSIDILVNNAGFSITNRFVQSSRNEWDIQINVIFYGALNCISAVLKHMISRQSGSIVNISSDAGRGGEPYQPVYSGVKEGIIGLTRALSKDVGKYHIRVNAVSPGLTETETTIKKMGDMLKSEKVLKGYPLGKIAKPQDIADMVVFIASDRAGHVTGQTISVNGGYYVF